MTTKERILEVVMQMLKDKVEPQNITVRDIAEKADVNLALINYHFKSKDNLIFTAAQVLLNNITEQLNPLNKYSMNLSPYDRLLKTMVDIADFIFKTYNLSYIGVSEEIKIGNTNTIMIILPTLKEHFKETKSDLELKLIALQIITPLQMLFLNAKNLKDFFYTDMFNKDERDKIIKKIIDAVI